MNARIAVWDPLPAFRRGVLAILRDSGLDADMPDDIGQWVRDDRPKLVILTVADPSDWVLLESLRGIAGDLLIVVLLDDTSLPGYVRALTSGAVTVIPRRAATAEIRDAIATVLRGEVVLPVEVLRALLTAPPELRETVPSPVEVEWLRELSSGSTVGQLAARAGYSERMMFRRLRELYTRMGVRTKMEALLMAQERGWF
jgi:DNA-binding NarL/FixJ family response regulator